MQNLKQITESINSLCELLDKEYDINNGGCCYIAYLIAKELDKLNIKYTLKIFDSEKKDRISIKNEVLRKKLNSNPNESVVGNNSCNHYCLYILRGGEINYGDFYTREYHCYTINNISAKNIQWIYKNGSWNKLYNTNNNKLIESLIKKHFKQYDKRSN